MIFGCDNEVWALVRAVRASKEAGAELERLYQEERDLGMPMCGPDHDRIVKALRAWGKTMRQAGRDIRAAADQIAELMPSEADDA